MTGIFYNLGKKFGPSWRRTKWIWQSTTGSKSEAVKLEYLVGADLSEQVRKQLEIIADPDITERISSIGAKLGRAVADKSRSFSFQVIASGEPNAFAIPGGFVFISSSMLQLCSDNNELAFVIAHEMAHIIRGHAMDRIISSTAISAASAIISVRSSLAGWLKKAGLRLLTSAYSQDNEFEADKLGVLLSRAAGFEPESAAALFRRMAQLQKSRDGALLSEYFSTHPPFERRISEILKTAADSRS